MPVTAKSERNFDLEIVISTYEFTDVNSTWLNTDGSLILISSIDKSERIH